MTLSLSPTGLTTSMPKASIAKYIKEIGRGKDGARPLTRAQAEDLFGLVLDGAVSDTEIGAFCIAMRVKGETTDELLGFIDAVHNRIVLPASLLTPAHVVIPSYNGARKLPLLTPLLAMLLAREGLSVVVHGMDEGLKTITGNLRVTFIEVIHQLRQLADPSVLELGKKVHYFSIDQICPAVKQLLDVRKIIGLRNSAHSVVKLINPMRRSAPNAVLVTSFTHPEYEASMLATLSKLKMSALLLRGTEGEAVADPRRIPLMQGLKLGAPFILQATQHGSVPSVMELPGSPDAVETAAYIHAVLTDRLPIPQPIALQVQHILKLL
jgi:anthranilate phosphoribosyltransferase